MAGDGLLYRVYERRLSKELESFDLPQHLGVIVDGNRRWAKAAGESTAQGHRAGAANRIAKAGPGVRPSARGSGGRGCKGERCGFAVRHKRPRTMM